MHYNRKFLDSYAKLNNRGCTLSIEMGEKKKKTDRQTERASEIKNRKNKIK